MKKRILNLILALIMALSLVPSVAFAAGSSFSTATTISTDTWYSDKLASRDEEDYFKFTLSQSGYITLSLKHDYVDNSGVIWQSYLYNTDCEEMLQLGSYFGNAKSTGTSAKIGLPAGTYYVKIRRGLSDIRNNWGDDWNNTPYYFEISFTASTAWETEDNNSFNSANIVKLNSTISGCMMSRDDIDYFKFTLPQAGYIALACNHDYVDNSGVVWQSYLYNTDCEEMLQLGSYFGNTKSTSTSTKIGLPAGTYYIKIRRGLSDIRNNWGDDWNNTPYYLKINYTVSSAWETELNNTFSTCDTIKSNTIVNGSITNNNGGATYNNDIDYYKFSLSNAGYISLSFKHDYVDSDSHYSRWRVYLYDSNCNEIMCWEFYGNTSATTITDRTKLQSGTYYLKVAEGSLYSDTPYSLKVNYGKPGTPAPSISCTASSGKPTLTWSAVSGAEKYEVWRATSSSGSYSKMYTTTSTSYTNTSANAGYTYYYKVRAVNAGGEAGNFSAVKSITCDCARPAVTAKCNATSGKPTLSWNAVSGAAKYYIYRSTDGGKTYKYWDSTTRTSYTNTGAVAGNTYYYKVKAISGRSSYADSAYSTGKCITCDCAKPTLSITTSSGHPKLSWNAVSGATKYYIYRCTDGQNFKYYDSTTKTSYTNTSAKAGTTYYYKVKAISGKSSYADSAYSVVKSIRAK